MAPVLTILYVLNTESRPCRILIDEPQAFLHPDALRRLLRVFRRYEQHQFILATHSPLVVSAAGVATCTLVRQEKVRSKKHGRQTLEVYDRLCAGSALVAPALGFQFDREQPTSWLVSTE